MFRREAGQTFKTSKFDSGMLLSALIEGRKNTNMFDSF